MTPEPGSPNSPSGGPGSSREKGRQAAAAADGWSPTDETLRPGRPSGDTRAPESSIHDHPSSHQIGRYRIERMLGRGGMGVVYEATHVEHGTRVALKMIRDLDGSFHRFLGEFHALAQLRHENLVRIDELALDGPEPYYTMELLDGINFLDWVRPTTELGAAGCDEFRLREGLAQLVAALVYVHRAGQLHRDLKPSNVIVTRQGVVKVVDFGLAARLDRRGRYVNSLPGAPVGTLVYMSPEQAKGEDLQAASDWYSVGVMIYECLTGELPFHARTIEELIEEKSRPVRAPAGWKAMPDLLDLAISLTHPDPTRRPDESEIIVRLGAEQTVVSTDERTFTGRDDILARLLNLFEDVRDRGASRVVFVHGASGMGKSATVQAFLDGLELNRRAEILTGRCYESVLVPYKALDALNVVLARRLLQFAAEQRLVMTPLDADALCEVLPVFGEVFRATAITQRLIDPQGRRRQAFNAYRELLFRLGPGGPLPGRPPMVLLLDDLQWGDLDSAALLAEIWRNPPPGMLMICSFRTEDIGSSPCLQAIYEARREITQHAMTEFDTIEVGPLSDEAAGALARDLLGELADDDRLIEKVVRESRGNPLFLGELARYLRRRAASSEATASSPPDESMTLDDVLADAVATLDEPARCVLEIVATAGRPLDRSLAFLAAGFEKQIADVLHRLIDERFLRSVGGEYYGAVDTYHDRVREMLLRRLEPQRRKACHGAIAQTLVAERYQDPEFLGQQFHASGDASTAAGYFVEAGEAAEKALAFDRAARLYRLAFDGKPQGERRRTLCLQLARSLANAGRGLEAASEYLEAAHLAEGDEAWQALCEVSLRFLTSGYIEDGLATLHIVLRDVGWRLPRSQIGALGSVLYWRGRLALRGRRPTSRSAAPLSTRAVRELDVCWSAVAGLSLVDPLRAAGYVARNLVLALNAGEPRRLIRALAVHTSHVAIGGSRSRRAADQWLATMRELAEPSENYAQGMVAVSEGIVAHLCGDWPTAWTRCEDAERLLRESEHPDVAWEIDTAQTFSLWARMYAGDYLALRQRQPDLRRNAIERDDLFARANFGARPLATVCLAAGRWQDAHEALEQDANLLPRHMFHVQHHNVLLARAMLLMAADKAREALGLMLEGWRNYRHALLSHVQQVRIDFFEQLGRAALAAAARQPGQRAALRAQARRASRRLRREKAPWSSAMVALLNAGDASFEASPAHVAEAYDKAARALRAAQMAAFAAAAEVRTQQWQCVAGAASADDVQRACQGLTQLGIERPAAWLPLLVPCRDEQLVPPAD